MVIEGESIEIGSFKRTWGAFTNTDLENILRKQEVTQIFLCGVATSIGVESTARQGFELGFNIVTVGDAMGDHYTL